MKKIHLRILSRCGRKKRVISRPFFPHITRYQVSCMYSPFTLALKYLRYYITASNGRGHGVHSPFIFNFITNVLNDDRYFQSYREIEDLRKKLLLDKTILQVEDFGAGSGSSKTKLFSAHIDRRSIASIAKNAAKPKKFGRLLFRMINYYQPETILELGTSLGISTCYLAAANPANRVVTMEGASQIARVALQNFKTSELKNIELIQGNFDEMLPSVIAKLSQIDFAFVDGNHRKEPTERYFNQLLSCSSGSTILVFDDIHWSNEMELAWETIKNDARVTCTIDLFFIGIVFFNTSFKEKQNITIRF
jgi:predicted O-methyltransferase YrrM